jgi:hypothetical protein
MVAPSAAPLIMSAFRRVRGKHAHRRVPDMRPRTRQSASTIRGATPDMTSGRADADQARSASLPSGVARERVSRHASHLPRRRRERIHTCAGRQSGSVLSFLPLHTIQPNQNRKPSCQSLFRTF